VTPNATYVQSAYGQVQVRSASQEEAVVLLFEGMVRFLHQAREAMQTRQLEQQSNLIGRAQRILSELVCALDETQDAGLVVALRCCYTSMYNRLWEANVGDDETALDEVIALAERFAQAWRTALQNVNGTAVAV
jgi:flagellar protein FliS